MLFVFLYFLYVHCVRVVDSLCICLCIFACFEKFRLLVCCVFSIYGIACSLRISCMYYAYLLIFCAFDMSVFLFSISFLRSLLYVCVCCFVLVLFVFPHVVCTHVCFICLFHICVGCSR